MEPVRSIDGDRYYVDLTFADADTIAVVAGIRIDRHALVQRDRSPFVAPREAVGVVGTLEAALDAIQDRLAAVFAEHGEPPTLMHAIRGVAERIIAERSAAGLLGAAPYARVARSRGRKIPDEAFIETCFGDVVPDATPASVVSFGSPQAPLRSYVAISDETLLAGGAAYRAALAIGAALGGDELAIDVAGYDGRPLEPYAFVHAVGLDDPEAAVELIVNAQSRGIRALLTPLFEDVCNGAYWGARAHARTLRIDDDEELLGGFLTALLARRLVFEDGIRPDVPSEPRPAYRDAQRAALSLADSVFVVSASEAQRIRMVCDADRLFAAYVPLAEPIPTRNTNVAPYILAIAPVGPLHASATIARAAARAGLPVRFAGTVVDGAYAARARSYLDDRSLFAPVDPGCGARVAVDVSWSGVDLHGLAPFAAAGVPIVASNRSDATEVFGSHGVWNADPADEVGITSALCDAWNKGGFDAQLVSHAKARCRSDVLRACLLSGYRIPEPV